jgi:hypothetical protein
VFVGEPLGTFQFNHQHVFNDDVSKVLTDVMTLVLDSKRRLGDSTETAKAEFFDKRALVDFFEESRP